MNEVKITYLVPQEENQTDSAFYCWSEGWETLATVECGDRKFAIGSNGEMRFNLPNGDVFRYTEDLINFGIDTDEKLRNFGHAYPEAQVNNNWFEFYEVDGEDSWEVHETLEEAIDAVKEILSTDLTDVSSI